MSGERKILINSTHKLFEKKGLFYKEFPSDYRQVRFFSMLVVQKAPLEIKEINLLEQQISELIKNAVEHGNKKDPAKKIQVWASFSREHAHLIVEDEGEGFQELERWNEFNLKRNRCFENRDFEELERYCSFRTDESSDEDGGSALFAALEYWDRGVVFNASRNAVAVYKSFNQNKRPGLELY